MCQHLDVLALLYDAGVELRILQRHRGVQIGHVIVRGLFRELVADKGITDLVKALDELPQKQAFLKVFVFQDRVGADDGRADVRLTHSLHEGGRHIGVQCLADTLDARQHLGIFGVQLLIGLRGLRSER